MTAVMRASGWACDAPVEAYPQGRYDMEQDILRAPVFNKLVKAALSAWAYWHFGIPCSSFSIPKVQCNKGTRTRAEPRGNGTLQQEIQGNRIFDASVRLIRLLHSRGSLWSIENPLTSYLWSMPALKRLARKPGVYAVDFCQCMYGLSFPDSPKYQCRKATRLLANFDVSSLARRCDGSHQHIHAVGTVKVRGIWYRRSQLACHYPRALCEQLQLAAAAAFHGKAEGPQA